MRSRRSRDADVMRVVVLAVIIAGTSVQPAFAYVDPNSSGLLYQILMPIIAIASTSYALLKKKISTKINSVVQRYFRNRNRTDGNSS